MWDSFITSFYQISDALIWIGLLVLAIVVLYGLFQAVKIFVETQLEPYEEPYLKAFWLWIQDTWFKAMLLIALFFLIAALPYILGMVIFVW